MNKKISLCDSCRADLPVVEHACEVCAIPMQKGVESKICGQCISQKTDVDYSISLFHYANPIDYLISQMKFTHQLSAAAVLADLLKNQIDEKILIHGVPDAIIPIPLYKTRLVERGFNQSLEIAKPISKNLKIPILRNTVVRLKETKTQTNLNKQDRLKNVSGCFTLLKKPDYSHIVIVDDVVTTGATTKELAKLLKKFGVEKVGVWSLARAELK